MTTQNLLTAIIWSAVAISEFDKRVAVNLSKRAKKKSIFILFIWRSLTKAAKIFWMVLLSLNTEKSGRTTNTLSWTVLNDFIRLIHLKFLKFPFRMKSLLCTWIPPSFSPRAHIKICSIWMKFFEIFFKSLSKSNKCLV